MGWKDIVGTIGKGMVEMLSFGKLVTKGLEGIGEFADAVGGVTGNKIQAGIGAITEGLKEIGQTAMPPKTQARILENKNNTEVEMAKIAYNEKKLTHDDQAGGRDVIKTAFEGKRLAQSLSLAVDRFFPDNTFRGIKQTTHLGVLKYTHMPAALIEVGFIDNTTTHALLSDPLTLKHIGHLLVSGIMRYAA